MKDTGGPAFPLHDFGTQTLGMHFTGMTLRDYFAAKAMQAQLSMPETLVAVQEKQITIDMICGASYEIADAMLKAREE